MSGRTNYLRAARTTVLLAALAVTRVGAQTLYPSLPDNRPALIAPEQFKEGHYLLAAQSCRAYLAREATYAPADRTLDRERATYHSIVAGILTNFVTGEKKALAFASATLNDAYRQRVYFALAQYYFDQDQLDKAIPFYEKINIGNLTNEEIADVKFEMAYCYFSEKNFAKAAPLFASIKEIKEGKYYVPGNYYYGLLSYDENKLDEALQSLQRIQN
ncbi:MAG: hypothetical protein EBZ77_08210, partial [Chitinophagia bacterium]|nr:hypothetical protein [Chitinophagia bacterium]